MPKDENRGVPLAPINVMDLSGGVQAKTTNLSNNNQFLHLINGDIYAFIGAVIGRFGSVVKNTTAKTFVSIKVFRVGTTRKYIVIASDGSNQVIYTVPTSDFSGTLTSVLAGHFTKEVNIHSANFATKEMFFNGLDAPKSYDGTSFATITNAPTAGKFPAVFQQRLYVFGTDGFLSYSDVINSSGNDFTTTTWANRGINPNDGQTPKAMRRHRGRLVLFKTESIYRYDGSNEPEPIINVGTHSERGVFQTDTEMFFHHHTEIYKMSLGDPIVISRPVEKYLRGMSVANWQNVALGGDANNVYCWIGDVTINDVWEWDYQKTYSNVTLVYNTVLDRWMVWTGWDSREWFTDTDNGNLFFITNDGNITLVDPTRFNDNGNAIDFQAMWHPVNYGAPHMRKDVDFIMIQATKDMHIRAGSSPATMDSEGLPIGDGTVQIRKQISFNELWIMTNASYNNVPPVLKMLHIGKSYARHQS